MASEPKTPGERRWRKAGAAKLSALVPGMIEPVLRQRGFANATILTEWSAIAGPHLARFSAPLELRWPKHRAESGEVRSARSGKSERAQKAVLIVSVASAFALELQMASAGLIQQVNRRLGFDCVGSIQIRQGLIAKPVKKPHRVPDPVLVAEVKAGMGDIRDDALRDALAVLGAEVKTGRTRL
jgi:hypothetical protein